MAQSPLNDNFNSGCSMPLKGNAEGSVNKYLSRNDSVQEIVRKESWRVFREGGMLSIVSLYIPTHTAESLFKFFCHVIIFTHPMSVI